MTDAELAILGLIAETPRHGYEIEQVLEQRNMRRWADIGFSSIYYLLNKLEAKGWIRSQPQPAEGKGPARKVYTITTAGQQAWYQATLAALSGPGQANTRFLTGLAENLPAFLQGMFEYSANVLQTELDWLDRYIPRFESQITDHDEDPE
jgi:DNA-binding PadR family transcriptional regulator